MDEAKFTIYASVLLVLGILFILRLVQVLPAACKNPIVTGGPSLAPKDAKPQSVSALIMLGSGGHTGEMIRILKQFKHLEVFKRRYIVSSGDGTSLQNISAFDSDLDPDACIVLPRARNIGEGKAMATVNTLKSFAATVVTFLSMPHSQLPDVFLCNGPGTSIPIAYTLFVLKFLGLCKTKVVYVESLARVNQLSLTGLLILPISDRVIVQWPQLQRYRRCEYYGMLV